MPLPHRRFLRRRDAWSIGLLEWSGAPPQGLAAAVGGEEGVGVEEEGGVDPVSVAPGCAEEMGRDRQFTR